nr:hypothetical protein [Tanacetum cinerariifolium]
KQEEKRIEEQQATKAQTWKLSDDDDDKESSNSLYDNISELPLYSAITPDEPVLSTEEPDNSLSMGDEHLDTIPVTESNEFTKSGVETLIPIPSESEGIPEHVCDVPSHDNSPPPDVSKDTIEDLSESNEEFSSTDDDSFLLDNIDYEVGGIKASTDNPIPSHDPIISGTPPNLTPSGENLDPEGNMLLFEAFLNDDHSSNSQTKSSSTSLNSLLEETRTFDNSLPEVTIFSNDPCDAECESDDQSYSDEDVLEKIVSLFDEFAGELTLLKSIPPGIDETDCHPEEEIHFTKRLLYDNSSPRPPKEFVSVNSDAAIKSFSLSPIPIKDSDSLMEEMDLFCTPDYLMPPGIEDKDVVENISPTKEPQVLNTLPTHTTLQLNLKFQPSSESLFAYVVWIFLPFLVYSVVPHYLLSLWNKDIIFDPGICKPTFSKPDISHRCRTIKTFNTHRSHLNTYLIMINGQNNPPLDVLLFHFYPLDQLKLKNTKKRTKSEQNRTKTGSNNCIDSIQFYEPSPRRGNDPGKLFATPDLLIGCSDKGHLVRDANTINIFFKNLIFEFCAVVGSYDDDGRLKKDSDSLQEGFNHLWFMNYLEEQTDGEAMINSIQNGDQPFPVIAQVSLAGNVQNAPPTLKDPKFWTAEEKKTRKIDRLARSLLIQGLPNDIYSLIDSNETAKDLWDALERQLRGFKYGEQDRKAQNQGDVNDALGYKKKAVVVTSDPLALVVEKMKVSKRKEKVVVSSDSEGSGADYFSELKKINALLSKAFN